MRCSLRTRPATRRTHILAAATLWAGLLLGPPIASADPASQLAGGATLTVLRGAVEVASGGQAYAAASSGQVVSAGDRVRVDSDGEGLLTFFDGTESDLQPESQVLVVAPVSGGSASLLQVAGDVVTRLTSLGSTDGFQTDMPTSVALVRGPQDRQVTLSVTAPTVSLAHAGGPFAPARGGETLGKGDRVQTGAGGEAALTFADGSKVRVLAQSQVEIVRADASSQSLAVRQITGAVASRVVAQPTRTPSSAGGGAGQAIQLGGRAMALAGGLPNGVAYALDDQGELAILAPGQSTPRATIPIGLDPLGVWTDPTANRLYVATGWAADPHTGKLVPNALTVVDPDSGAVTATAPVGLRVSMLVADPARNRLYVGAVNTDGLTVLDDSSFTPVGQVQVPAAAAAAADPASGTLYTLSTSDATLTSVDPASLSAVGTVSLDGAPDRLAYDASSGRLYTASATTTVLDAVDVAAGQVAAQRDLGAPVGAIAVDANSHRLYVGMTNSADVAVLDGDQLEPVGTVSSRTPPALLGLSADYHQLFVAGWDATSVAVLPV